MANPSSKNSEFYQGVMKKCIICNNPFKDESQKCDSCGWLLEVTSIHDGKFIRELIKWIRRKFMVLLKDEEQISPPNYSTGITQDLEPMLEASEYLSDHNGLDPSDLLHDVLSEYTKLIVVLLKKISRNSPGQDILDSNEFLYRALHDYNKVNQILLKRISEKCSVQQTSKELCISLSLGEKNIGLGVSDKQIQYSGASGVLSLFSIIPVVSKHTQFLDSNKFSHLNSVITQSSIGKITERLELLRNGELDLTNSEGSLVSVPSSAGVISEELELLKEYECYQRGDSSSIQDKDNVVSISEETFSRLYDGDDSKIIFKISQQGNYLIILRGAYQYLLPKKKRRITSHIHNTTKHVYDCDGYSEDYEYFRLAKPALVEKESADTDFWKLSRKGTLKFT